MTSPRKPYDTYIVFGAGGHGRVVAEALALRFGREAVLGFLDDAPPGATVLGWPVERLDAWGAGRLRGCLVLAAIGDNRRRQEIVYRIEAQNVHFGQAVHPDAAVSPSAALEPGVMILAGAVVNAQARIGAHAIVNSGAVVEHDCAVGDFAHIAPRACLGGGAAVGARTLVGIGACVLPGVKIGEDCIIGAGAVVLRDVPPGTTLAGVPARPIRPRPPLR